MPRQRLTITLKDEIITQLDSVIDGEKIRNRSHAIESILSEHLSQKSPRVLILAGGKGVSFPQLAPDLPKALLPIHGRPLLEHTILKLKSQKLTDIVISIGAHGQKIRDYFRNGSRLGVNISYIEQASKKGTAQPLLQAKQDFSQHTFLLVYGDVLCDIDFLDLLGYHHSQNGLVATMALTSVEHVSMWGVARLVGSKIISFEEKPLNPKTHSHLVNAGVYVLEPEIFDYISPEDSKLESSVLPRLAEEGKLGGYIFDGQWFDVSNNETYMQINKK